MCQCGAESPLNSSSSAPQVDHRANRKKRSSLIITSNTKLINDEISENKSKTLDSCSSSRRDSNLVQHSPDCSYYGKFLQPNSKRTSVRLHPSPSSASSYSNTSSLFRDDGFEDDFASTSSDRTSSIQSRYHHRLSFQGSSIRRRNYHPYMNNVSANQNGRNHLMMNNDGDDYQSCEEEFANSNTSTTSNLDDCALSTTSSSLLPHEFPDLDKISIANAKKQYRKSLLIEHEQLQQNYQNQASLSTSKPINQNTSSNRIQSLLTSAPKLLTSIVISNEHRCQDVRQHDATCCTNKSGRTKTCQSIAPSTSPCSSSSSCLNQSCSTNQNNNKQTIKIGGDRTVNIIGHMPTVRPGYLDPGLSISQRVVTEIIETERTYVYELEQIVTGYICYLRNVLKQSQQQLQKEANTRGRRHIQHIHHYHHHHHKHSNDHCFQVSKDTPSSQADSESFKQTSVSSESGYVDNNEATDEQTTTTSTTDNCSSILTVPTNDSADIDIKFSRIHLNKKSLSISSPLSQHQKEQLEMVAAARNHDQEANCDNEDDDEEDVEEEVEDDYDEIESIMNSRRQRCHQSPTMLSYMTTSSNGDDKHQAPRSSSTSNLRSLALSPSVPIVTATHIKKLFSNLEDIYKFNRDFLFRLEECYLNPSSVAECFVENASGFGVYTHYCTTYPLIVSTLTELMAQPASAQLLMERQVELGQSLPLGAYLLKPVQRILKYHILFQSLMTHIEHDETISEKDRILIGEALSVTTGIASHINTMKRKHEHAIRVQEVQGQLSGWMGPDLTTLGELILEDTFKLYGRPKTHRHLFLFDNVLLMTKKRRDGCLTYKGHIACSNLMLIENIEGQPLVFNTIPFDNPRGLCAFEAKNMDKKRDWCLQMKEVIIKSFEVEIPGHVRNLLMSLTKRETAANSDAKAKDGCPSASEQTSSSSLKPLRALDYLERKKSRQLERQLVQQQQQRKQPK